MSHLNEQTKVSAPETRKLPQGTPVSFATMTGATYEIRLDRGGQTIAKTEIAEHSLLPWINNGGQIETANRLHPLDYIVATVGEVNNQSPLDTANARLIVRAVNNTDKLAAALQSTTRELTWSAPNPSTAQLAALNDARAALAAYEGGKQS